MNLHGLSKVERGQFYLDVAIRAAKQRIEGLPRTLSPLERARRIAKTKVSTLVSSLKRNLHGIVVRFPSFDDLPEFYVELCRISFDLDAAKRDLATLDWTTRQLDTLATDATRRISRATQVDETDRHRRSFYGRASSLIKRADSALRRLDTVRFALRAMPTIKTNLFTVCIAGFPNVGKSTLLAALTGASPVVADYEFTTRRLNCGYTTIDGHKLQLIDTPGTLARFERMNPIEQQAQLALKYLAEVIIFVYDPKREPEGQLRLLAQLNSIPRPLLVHISKQDIASPEEISTATEALKEYVPLNREELLRALLEQLKRSSR